MRKILKNIYIETNYPGVTLGAVTMPAGTVMIDAPPRPDDGRAWRAELREQSSGENRILILLDSHPDRALGARALESAVLAHNLTAQIFEGRTAIFKAQQVDSGAEWERCSGLSGIRWMQPQVLFNQRAILNWGDQDILVEHHPGPERGAAWVVLPDSGVVFVGDAVVVKQPPFLARANLDAWIESLDLLLAKPYKDYKIISSRGGLVQPQDIRSLRRFLADTAGQLERLAKKKQLPDAAGKLAPKLLKKFSFAAKYRNMYEHRLSYGLYHYYARHYRAAPASANS
jgi:glyoxylase-like metal-dependent hydrolase (beta-lactamase superfamily II)